MSRALEIAKACVPSARSELPLDSHARAILVGVAADLIQAELDRVTAQVKDLTEALINAQSALHNRAMELETASQRLSSAALDASRVLDPPISAISQPERKIQGK